ncbi:MAG: hypothetical protein V1491_00200 [archaeon]
MRKRDIVARGMLLIFVGLMFTVLFYLSGILNLRGITGFAVFESSNQSIFDEGDYTNTIWNGSAVVLAGENLTGTYTSKVFDASSKASWNNLTSVYNEPNLEVLFAVDGSGGVYSSLDLGANWIKINDSYGGGVYTADMAEDKNSNLYILLNQQVYKSTDLGITWIVINGDFNPDDGNNGLVIDSDSNNFLYIVDGSGDVWKSTDAGISFSNVGDFNGGSSSNAKGIAVNFSDSIFISDADDDVWVSTDSGVTWIHQTINYGGTLIDDMDSDSNSYLYILSNRDIYQSTDAGITWVKINDLFSDDQDGLTIMVDSEDNIFIIDPSGDVWKSTDAGISFSNIGDFNAGATTDNKGFTSMLKNTNLTYQVRNCSSFDCSDGIWKGVDLNNINLIGQYFQYKVTFSSPDVSVTPLLKSVSIDYELVNIAPTMTIISPQQGATYGDNESLTLNFIAFDTDDNLESCWYNINGGSNVVLPSCANTSFDVPSSGDYNLTIYANDSQGEESEDSVSFSVEVGAPTIILSSPIDVYFNNGENISFDYIPTDIDLDSCELWGNFNGSFALNQIAYSPTNGVVNNFILNLSDGDYLWSVRCNDSIGNSAFNGNKTFYVDGVNPSVSISEPAGRKTLRTGIPLSFSVLDNHLDSCWYNVYRGESMEIVNTSVNCSGSATFNVTIDADFVLNFYANDSAGNLNVTNSIFSVDISIPASPSVPSSEEGGGGGGGYFSSSTIMNLELTPIEAIMYLGEEKSLELIVKNNGVRSVNKCKLKTSEEQKLWFSSTDIKNIASGEIVEFGFILTLPIDSKNLELSLECLEGSESVPLDLVFVKPSLVIEFSEIVLKSSNEILIKYLAESEFDLVSSLVFSAYSDKEKVAEQMQEIRLVGGESVDKEVIIEIKDGIPSGLLKLSVINQGEEKPLVESSIIYDSNIISGFAVDGIVDSDISYVVIIILVFLVFAIVIIRRIVKNRQKKR